MDSTSQLVSLAKRQLDEYSCDTRTSDEEIISQFDCWNSDDIGKVLITLDQGRVYLHSKKPDQNMGDVMLARLDWYLELFHEVASRNPGLRTTFAVSLWDEVSREEVPLFGYQKNRHERGLLLPDVDLLANRSFGPGSYDDGTPYDQKVNKAVFVGSTTGGGLITSENLDASPPARVRSALFFKGNKDVIFELPIIAQCDSSKTEASIRALGLGDEIRHWEWQLQNRFILSMDGNGATCSRVAIALKSNSVLCKYYSPHELYYFALMIPWVHYIPVAEDADVEVILEMERKRPGRFKEVAENGSKFFREYLVRDSVVHYTGALLNEYSKTYPGLSRERFRDQELVCRSRESWVTDVQTQDDMTENVTGVDDIITNSMGHVSNYGDHVGANSSVVGLAKSGKSLEGINFTLRGDFKNDFKYRVQFSNGSFSEWVTSGEYAGSRLQALSIADFEVNASEAFHKIFEMSLELRDINGGIRINSGGKSTAGSVAIKVGSPLELVTLSLVRRRNRGNRENHSRLHALLAGISDPQHKLAHIHQSLQLLHETFDGEIDEQRLFSEFIEPHMKVLEIGANVGRSTLVIAALLNNPENLVSFECDSLSYQRLIDNRDCNGLTCNCVNAAISQRKLIQAGWSTIPSEIVHHGFTEVPTMKLSEVKERYPLSFDTLVLDCEGAFYHILKDTPEILDGITTVILENDFSELAQKEFVDDAFRSRGLKVRIQKPGPWGPCADRFYEVWKK
jgi:FkbM family methyltransferase